MENKLKLIKEKCIEANPEIVKLKFGCELRHKEFTEAIKTYVGMNVMKEKICLYQNGLETTIVRNLPLEDEYEIIGRPITLSDVLLAMPVFDHNSVYDVVSHWNLKQNDLEKQDKPTINFLYELLK